MYQTIVELGRIAFQAHKLYDEKRDQLDQMNREYNSAVHHNNVVRSEEDYLRMKEIGSMYDRLLELRNELQTLEETMRTADRNFAEAMRQELLPGTGYRPVFVIDGVGVQLDSQCVGWLKANIS